MIQQQQQQQQQQISMDEVDGSIHGRMHDGALVDLTKPRRPPMMDEPLPICREKALKFLVTMGLIQQQRSRSAGHVQSRVVADIISSISGALGLELHALMVILTTSCPPPHSPVFFHGCVENAVHPYCKAFYTEAFATFSWVNIGGEDRIYANRPFAELFDSEEALNRELAMDDKSSPRAMIQRTIHPSDKDEFDRLLDYCFFISEEECAEAVHVLRCQSVKTGRGFMALVRFRSATWHKGWYTCGTLSLQPLPLPVSLFAYRDNWWHLARASEGTDLSSTAALIGRGDEITNNHHLMVRKGDRTVRIHHASSASSSSSSSSRTMRSDSSISSTGDNNGTVKLKDSGPVLAGSDLGGGVSSLPRPPAPTHQEERDQPSMENQSDLYVPGAWSSETQWPRLQRPHDLAEKSGGGGGGGSSREAAARPHQHLMPPLAKHAANTTRNNHDPPAVLARHADSSGTIHGAPASLRLEELNTMMAAPGGSSWAPGGAVLPPFPPQFEQVQKQLGQVAPKEEHHSPSSHHQHHHTHTGNNGWQDGGGGAPHTTAVDQHHLAMQQQLHAEPQLVNEGGGGGGEGEGEGEGELAMALPTAVATTHEGGGGDSEYGEGLDNNLLEMFCQSPLFFPGAVDGGGGATPRGLHQELPPLF